MSTPMSRRTPESARWAVAAVFFVFGAEVGAWVPHIPEVKRALGLSDHVLGLALLCSGFGATAIMPFLGWVIHRFGSRHASVVSGLGACCLVPWLVLEPSLPAFMANLFCIGLCYGCLDVSMNAHAVAVQDRHERPILSGIHGGFSLGGFAGGAGAALAAWVHLAALPHLLLNSALLAALLLAADRYLLPAEVDKDSEGPRFVLPKGILLTLGLLCLCAFVAEGGIWEWSAVYVRDSLGARPELLGIATAASPLALAIARFVGDEVVHRLGNVRVLIGSGIISAAGILISVGFHSVWAAIAGFAILGLGAANIVPILFRAAGSVPGISAGAGLAAVSTCAYAGFLIGPPLIGYVADWRSLGFSLGLLSLLCLAVTVFGPGSIRHLGTAEAPVPV